MGWYVGIILAAVIGAVGAVMLGLFILIIGRLVKTVGELLCEEPRGGELLAFLVLLLIGAGAGAAWFIGRVPR